MDCLLPASSMRKNTFFCISHKTTATTPAELMRFRLGAYIGGKRELKIALEFPLAHMV